MSKTKKWTSLIFAIVLGVLTCGVGLALPSFSKQSSKLETLTAVNYDTAITASQLTKDSNGFYQITSAEELKGVAYAISQGQAGWASANYALTTDINLADALWTPIGTATNPFVGKFNGNGHTISGAIGVEASSYDSYVGLFGVVGNDTTQAAIYDLVLGSYNFTPSYTELSTAGRLAGKVQNAVLADIYDWAYVNMPTSLNYQTIGTMGTVTIYGGDTFVLGTASSDGTWTYNLKTPANYNETAHGFQFGYYNVSASSTIAGRSVYIVDDETGIFYKNGDSTKADLGSLRILKNSGGAAIDAATVGIISDKYTTDLPTIIGNTAPASGLTLEPASTGKKPLYYAESATATSGFTSITGNKAYTGNGPLYVVWKDLSYNITVNLGFEISSGVTTMTLNGVGFNTPWSEIVSQISRPNDNNIAYILVGLTDPNDSNKPYYTAEVTWDADYSNYKVEPSYPNGDTAVAWDSTGANSINVTLNATWQQSLANITVNFDKTEDTSLNFANAFAGDLSAAYTTGSAPEDFPLGMHPTNEDSSFDFSAAGGATVNITIPVTPGYVLGTVTNTGSSGEASISNSGDTYTLTISDAYTSDVVINVPVYRTTYDISVISDEHVSDITISGNSAGTTYEETNGKISKITTRVDETFTLAVTYAKGYAYSNVVSNDPNLSATTTDGSKISVSVDAPLSGSPSITIQTRALSFDAYLHNINDQPYNPEQSVGTVIFDGTEWTGDTSWENHEAPGENGLSFVTTDNEYYKVDGDYDTNGLKVTTDAAGNTPAAGVNVNLVSNENGVRTYTITGIAAGGEYHFHVQWIKQTYSPIVTTGSTSDVGSTDFVSTIPGADGKAVANNDDIFTITKPDPYSPFDTLTFSYNIESQYYEFAGWYYLKNNELVLINNGDTVFGKTVTVSGNTLSFVYDDEDNTPTTGAPAQAVAIYAAVTGKAATITLPTDARNYYEIGSTITNAGTALSSGSTSVTFKYGDPDFGSITTTMDTGYNLSRVVIGTGDLTSADNTLSSTYELFGTSGYAPVQDNEDILSAIFIDGDAKIYILAAPKSITVTFDPGEGTTELVDPITETYYYNVSLDATQYAEAFTKTGYSGSGWTLNDGLSSTGIPSNEFNIDFMQKAAAAGRPVTATRTYTANSFSLSLNPNGGEFAANIETAYGGTLKTENDYTSVFTFNSKIAFDAAISSILGSNAELPTPTRTGYNFMGWQIGSETITAATVWDWEADQTAVAQWEAITYDVVINPNGGTIASSSALDSLTITYGQSFASLLDGAFYNTLAADATRNGFTIDSLNFMNSNDSAVIKSFNSSSDATFADGQGFTDFAFGTNLFDDEGNPVKGPTLTLVIKWAFADNAFEDIGLYMDGQYKTYTGNAQDFQLITNITNNTNLALVDDDSIIARWFYSAGNSPYSWEEKENFVATFSAGGYNTSLTNVADSGYYSVILTFVDTASIEALRDTLERNFTTSNSSIPIGISPAQLLQFNDQLGDQPFAMMIYGLFENAKNILANYPNARTILNQSMGNGLDYISQFDDISTYSGFEAWILGEDGAFSGADDYNRLGFVSKIVLIPMLYDVNMRDILLSHPRMADTENPIFSDFIARLTSILENINTCWTDVGTGNTYVNGYFTSFTDEDVSGANVNTLNQIFNMLAVLIDMYTDFESSIWNSQVSSAFTSNYATKEADVVTIDIEAWDTSKTFVISNDAGAKYLAYRFTPGTSFDANNFLNAVQVNFATTSEYASYSGYYVVIDQYYLNTAMGWPEFSPILYAPTTVLELPATQVAQTDSVWTDEIAVDLSTATNGKYTQVVATVQTSAATPGTYSFIDKVDEDGTPFGRLIITSFKLYVTGTSETENQEDTAYYIFNRKPDGSYTLDFKNGANIPQVDWISAQDPVLANISLAIEQDFEIIATEKLVPISFQTVALSATSDGAGLGGDFVDGTVTIKSVTVQETGGESFQITIGSDGTNYDIYENGYYGADGLLIFTISGQTIQFNTNSGYSLVSIDVTSSYSQDNYYFAGYYIWTGSSAVEEGDINNVEKDLKSLSDWADTTRTWTDFNTTDTTEGTQTLTKTYISAVYTNASWVTFDAKTDDGAAFNDGFALSEFFAEIGTDVSFDNYDNSIDYNVYTFDGFGKSESSKLVEVADAPKQTFTAVIGLATPTGVSIPNQNFAAQLEGDLDLSTLAGDVNITNNGSSSSDNNHGITYTYTWYDSDPSVEGASAIESISANASSDGTYYVVVTATKTGFNNSDTAQASFTITFEKTTLSLTAPTGSLKQTYKNEDFRNDITIGVALANDQASDLPTYPAGISLSAILSDSTLGSILDVTIQKQTEEDAWEDVGEDGITGAGTYRITVALKPDVNVGNAYEYALGNNSITFDFTVTKKVVKINAGPGEGTVTTSGGTGVVDGVLFSKSLDYNSDANRVYPVNVAVDGITGVNQIPLNLKRADDKQTAGNYKLVINEDATYTALSANYDISIIDNTWFRILPSSGGLQAIATVVEKEDLENGIVDNTRIYNGADHSSTVRIEKAIKEGTEDEYEFQLVTYLVYNGEGDPSNVEWARYSLVLQTVSDEDGTLDNIDIITDLDTSFFDGWTFTLEPGANVDSYIISCSGKNASYPSFEFIGGTTPTLTIDPRPIKLTGFSKPFDGITAFDTAEGNTVTIGAVTGNEKNSGLIGGQTLRVTATYASKEPAEGIALSNVELVDDGTGFVSNYTIDPSSDKTGTITKSSTALTLTATKTTFTYGNSDLTSALTQETNPTLQTLATTLGLTVSGYTKGKDYDITVVSIETADYSTTGYLKAGTYTVKVILTSTRYQVTDTTSDDDSCTHTFTLTVEKKLITASPTTFEKDYDGDAYVEQDITLEDVVEGDLVRASAEYVDANVGTGKTVTITLSGTLSGDDSANYTLTDQNTTSLTTTGAIKAATIILNANIQNNTDDGKFVDQKEASGTTKFTIKYQNGMSDAETLALLTAPNKLGYTFDGWAVDEAVGTFTHGTILNKDIILSFLAAIRERENTDESGNYPASIYATWTKNQYKITVTDSTDMGDHDVIEELNANSQSTEGGTTTYTYIVDYYTTWTFTRVANSGYVLQGEYSETFNFTYSSGVEDGAETNLTDKTFTVVDGDFRAAVININISVDTEKNYYGQWNAGESTYNFTFANLDGDGNDSNNGKAVWEIDSMHIGVSSLEGIASTDLANTNIQTYFARAALAGYTFTGWSYQGSSEIVTIDYNAGGDYQLSEIVNELYPSYTDDITINITAVLKANTYSLTLNPDGGAFADDVEDEFGGTLATENSDFTFTNKATYGAAINLSAIKNLPIPTREGYTFAGWQIDGTTISTISEDSATTNDAIWQWASDMTATAIWSEGNFTLTVTLDTGTLANAGASVTISYQVADGSGTRTEYVDGTVSDEHDNIHIYTLNHGIDYTITVTTNEGYVITWPDSVSGFTLDGTGDTRTISGIHANSKLEIKITAASHTVKIVPPTNGRYDIKIGGDKPDSEDDTYTAATEQTIVVTITPDAGYSVTGTPTENGFKISNESNVFTITNFTGDITIDFSSVVTANSYNMTVTYDDKISAAGLKDGSSSTDEGETTYTVLVSTGTTYEFYIQEVYGYNYSDITVSGTADVVVSENAETEGEYAGYRKVTVSGYTAAFGLTIVTTKDVFTVKASAVAVDSEFKVQKDVNGISVDQATQDVEYLSQATITATNNNNAYGFIGWFDASVVTGGTVNTEGVECLSTESTYKPTVEGDINVIALFQYKTYTVNISIKYTDRVVGTDHASFKIGEGENTYTSYSGTMSHNDSLKVTADPADGYKLVGWYVGAAEGSAASTEATYETTITGELTLVMLIDASDLEVTFTPTVRINGVSFSGEDIASLGYGTIQLGTYDASTEKFTRIDWPEGNNFVAKSYTGGTLYVRVAANDGYEFNGLYNLSGNPTFSQILTTEDGIIYEIRGLIYNVEIDYNVEVRFTAISTPINIVFSDDENQLEAGRITVTSGSGLNIVQNNTHNVTVHATTGSQVLVTAYISLGQGFMDPANALNNLRITTSSGTIANPEITIPKASTGWSAQISFEITGFTGTPVVEVLVKPKTYTVNLIGWDSSDLGSFEVTYGAPIVLPEGLTISPRDGFALLGFYKYANGVGTRFIDGDLKPIGNWTDNGYRRNSDGEYVVTDNFVKPEKGIFEIYASYSINKARLQIDVVPPGLENVPPTVAANIVVLGTTTANSWSSSEDPSFVEVREGATISVQAPVYENYRFAYWTIVRTNRAGASTREIVTSELIENFEHDGYSLVTMTLTYYANVGVVANGNGSASLTYWDEINQQFVEVTGSEYIPTTSPITLRATPDDGYDFVGWFTQDGKPLTDEPTHVVSASLANPLSPTTYEARFESKTFRMNITVRNPEAISIQTVSVAGQQVADFANGFDVKLGQMVTLTVAVAQNTNIAWNGVGALIPMLNNRYIYTVSYSDLVDGEINLEAYVSYEECDVNISVNLTNGIETEKSLAANIYYFEDSQPIQISAINGVTLSRVIGSTLELRIDLRANYKLDSILVDGVDSGVTLDGNIARIVLTPQGAYTDTIDIQVNIARDMWLDSVSSEEHALSGEGTDSNPYMVRTADDLAFVAYMINVENSTEYADAVYVLDADIDLSSRYWSPIGTESNPFNGKFYYRNYSISNVSVVYNYSGELTRDGVFGYITENAEFEMEQGDWLIAVIIVSVVLLLIIIALIIFFVIRNKRKKKLEQLANS